MTAVERTRIYATISATCLVAVAVDLAIDWATNFDLLRLSYATVPVGAVLLGTVGVSGRMISHRFRKVPVTKVDVAIILAFPLAVLGIIYFGEFFVFSLRHQIGGFSFQGIREFLIDTITRSHWKLNGRDQGEVGISGYAFLGFQIIGCSLPFVAAFDLIHFETCDRCDRVLRIIARRKIGPLSKSDADQFIVTLRKCSWPAYGAAVRAGKALSRTRECEGVRIRILLRQCPNCRREQLSELVETRSRLKWTTINFLSRRTFVPDGLSLKRRI